MPALKESHIVRIAVELENQTAQLIKFDRRQPLTGQWLYDKLILFVGLVRRLTNDS